jgi:hypothetical protein
MTTEPGNLLLERPGRLVKDFALGAGSSLVPPSRWSIAKILGHLLLDTGGSLADAPSSAAAASTWFRAMWTAGNWQSVVEDVLERLEEGRDGLDEGDLAFLADVVVTREGRPRAEVRAAIRLLGGIGEERYAPLDRVRPYLTDLLSSSDAGIRVAAAEAIWQTGDRAARPFIESALRRERDEHASTTLEHVLRVLR